MSEIINGAILMKNIMFQGTASSAGKTLVAAGIGRLFSNKGFKPCPFKSQNMSSLSVITSEGKEISHSQALQARACRLRPDVRMNPILLKPVSNQGSQVIFLGKNLGVIPAAEYYKMKESLREEMLAAYHSLSREYEIMIIEGAGSPAEINLRKGDFVNMGLAHAVDAPVVLIGDIDRGGVFASLYGTQLLLDEEDRSRIMGFIINKFRGDVTLLTPAIEEIEEKMGIACLGVLPYTELSREAEEEDRELDRWAGVLEEHLDINKIEEIIGC
jgi:adenosylcobyric acid synthase